MDVYALQRMLEPSVDISSKVIYKQELKKKKILCIKYYKDTVSLISSSVSHNHTSVI